MLFSSYLEDSTKINNKDNATNTKEPQSNSCTFDNGQ